MTVPLHGLYPLIDDGVCRIYGIEPVSLAEACLRGGARMLQVRCKTSSGAEFLSLARRIVARAREHDVAVIVNDRADIARLSGADGVHVGQEDLSIAEVRGILGPDAIVGISTHDEAQIDAALATDATYVAVGPIFGTASKDTGYTARGLELLRYAARRGKPVVAIGGITRDRATSVVEAGAAGVAVISALLSGGDPEARTRELVAHLARAS